MFDQSPTGLLLADKMSGDITIINGKALELFHLNNNQTEELTIMGVFKHLSVDEPAQSEELMQIWNKISLSPIDSEISCMVHFKEKQITLEYHNFSDGPLASYIQITVMDFEQVIHRNPHYQLSKNREVFLNTFVSTIFSKSNSSDISDSALALIHSQIPFDQGLILFYNKMFNTMIISGHAGKDVVSSSLKGLQIDFDLKQFKNQQPVEIHDFSHCPLLTQIKFEQENLPSHGLLIPICFGERPYGALFLARNKEEHFGKNDQELLARISSRLGFALSQINLVEEISQWADQLEAVSEATLQLTSILDPEEVIKIILEASLKLNKTAENAHLFLMDENLNIIIGKAFHIETGYGDAIFPTRKAGLTMTTARTRGPILVENMREHPIYENAPKEWQGAIIGIPLIYQGVVVGVMTIYFNKPQRIPDAQLQIIILLADQAAIALQNARLFSQVNESRKLNSALLEISRATTSSLDLKIVFNAILSESHKILPYTSGNILVLENEEPSTIIPTHDNFTEESKETALNVLRNAPLVKRVLKTKRPVLIPDVRKEPDWTKVDDGLVINSWLAIPLVFHDQLIGVLCLDHKEPNTYSEHHIEIAQALSSEVAVALQNAKLFSEALQARELSNTLLEIARTTSSSLDLTNVVHSILSESQKLIPYHSGNIVVFEGQYPIMFIPSSEYKESETPSNLLELLNDTVHFKAILRSREPYLISEVRKDPSWRVLTENIVIESWLGVPLIFHDKIIGILSFNHAVPGYYTKKHVEISKALSAEAAVALQNALFYQDAQNYADSLEQRVEARTKELEQINHELETFAYSVSHDLRTPLRAMEGFSLALYEDYSEALDDLGKEYAKRIMASTSRMDALIQDLLEYSRLSMANIELVALNTTGVINDACLLLQDELENREARLFIQPDLPDVMGNESILRQSISNLVANALKFVHPERKPDIRIEGEDLGNILRIKVIDNGIGIHPDYQDRIFEVFERLHTREDYPGTGIGLAIVKRGIEHMGGKVGVQSDGNSGSTFLVELLKAYD